MKPAAPLAAVWQQPTFRLAAAGAAVPVLSAAQLPVHPIGGDGSISVHPGQRDGWGRFHFRPPWLAAERWRVRRDQAEAGP